jgi:hypothetical protein
LVVQIHPPFGIEAEFDKTRGALLACAPSVLGRSNFKALTIKGAVMMKMTNKTIITSTKGVTLMSLMGV